MKPIWELATAIMMSTTLLAAVGAQTQAGAQKTDMTPRGAAIVAHGTSAGAVACARCHGFDGLSDSSGAFPILSNQSADYLSKQLRDFSSGTRLNAIMTPIEGPQRRGDRRGGAVLRHRACHDRAAARAVA
jgi:cytochrome c553